MSPREARLQTWFDYTALCAGYRRANPPLDKDGKPRITKREADARREAHERLMRLPLPDLADLERMERMEAEHGRAA